MPNSSTFSIPQVNQLINEYIPEDVLVNTPEEICEPFPLEYKMDATDYLNQYDDGRFAYGLFDPPYSTRQLKECYNGKGEYDTKVSTWSNWKKLYARKLDVDGISIHFGWNSGGIGKTLGFEPVKILLIAHGGLHNDTICVVEKKIKHVVL